jgi:hypothetical protein
MPDITVVTHVHPREWIMVPVSICGVWRGEVMFNTFTPISAVSAGTAAVLEAFRCFGTPTGRELVLEGLAIGGVRLPSLAVRVSRAATMLDVEGMLGLNFLNQYSHLHHDAAERTLRLEWA